MNSLFPLSEFQDKNSDSITPQRAAIESTIEPLIRSSIVRVLKQHRISTSGSHMAIREIKRGLSTEIIRGFTPIPNDMSLSVTEVNTVLAILSEMVIKIVNRYLTRVMGGYLMHEYRIKISDELSQTLPMTLIAMKDIDSEVWRQVITRNTTRSKS